MGELSGLINIGEELERQLHLIDIHTREDLARYGSTEAWLRIKAIDPSACINRLMGLEGALQGIRWHNLPEEEKKRLKAFYNAHP